jgi:asparagine synthase (glutamine-hydrolysing)
MCGINGLFSYNGAAIADPSIVVATRDSMVHRGPDGSGLWISGDRLAALGHRRLAIIDTSEAGAQPMSSHDGRFHISFNGEIYNYRELRSLLKGGGARLKSLSDTEVLLELFAQEGLSAIPKLRGMYAVAIYDQHSQELHLARDPLGIKPIYYADTHSSLIFASQVKALSRQETNIDLSVDPAGVVGFLLWGHVPEPFTLHRGISELPAGFCLTVRRGGRLKLRALVSLRERLSECSNAVVSDGNARDQLRDALVDTVRHHMIADVPVGIFLSAGLDSTTLTGIASEDEHNALKTVTLGFEEFVGTHMDEVPLARAVAELYGTNHSTVWVKSKDFDDEFARLIERMDQPTIDGINTYFVARAAHQCGLKVALSGVGADEIFGGYPSFIQVPRIARLNRMLGPIAHFGQAFRRVCAPLMAGRLSPKFASLVEYGGSVEGAYFLRRALYMPWELPDLIDPDFAREGLERLQPFSRLKESIEGISGDYHKVMALELTWYMRNQLLRDTDWSGMAHSLEIRTPFVDLQFATTMAALMSLSNRPGKWVMASTPQTPLPRAVLTRPKTGFAVPLDRWAADKGVSAGGRGARTWAQSLLGHWGLANIYSRSMRQAHA